MYTSEILHTMKGQAVKDVWHAMIGKPAGLKNTTGLKNTEEIIQAILKAQEDSSFVSTYKLRTPKVVEPPVVEATMPPKKQAPKEPKKSATAAFESAEIPMSGIETRRISLRKLHLEHVSYFLDPLEKTLYTIVDSRPGSFCGYWDPETQTVSTEKQ